MMYFLGFLLLVAAVSARFEDDMARTALQNPDLFEGDIMGIDPNDRNVVPHPQRRWSDKTIPYVIDSSLDAQTSLIKKAMDDYHSNTCLKFKERTTEKNYINIFEGKGCYSFVGMIDSGKQNVSLGPGCWYKGTIVHELGHAIGFFHEQNRSDRDKYLIIYWDNIKQGMAGQFGLLAPHQNLLLTPFDHKSIMLYGNYAFSKDRSKMTMVAKNGDPLKEPYEKDGLTASDIERVKKMYNC